jgi:hypothetical protein
MGEKKMMGNVQTALALLEILRRRFVISPSDSESEDDENEQRNYNESEGQKMANG